MCISAAQARTKQIQTKWLLWNVRTHFDCAGSHKTGVAGLAYGTFLADFHIALVKRPCAFRPRRLLQNETSHTDIWPKDVLEGASTEILLRDLSWRSCSEILPRDTLQRSCQQSSCRDLVHRSCQETSYGGPVQGPGGESIGVPRRAFLDPWTERSFFEILYKELLWRSPIGILCR